MVAIVATILALAVLLGGEWFDWWNLRKYKKDRARPGADPDEVFRKNRQRKAWFNRFALLFLFVSLLGSLYTNLESTTMNEEEFKKMQTTVAAMDVRLAKLEGYFGNPPGHGDPSGGPDKPKSPSDIGARLEEIEQQLADKVSREQLEIIREQLAGMQADIEKMMEFAGGAPAG